MSLVLDAVAKYALKQPSALAIQGSECDITYAQLAEYILSFRNYFVLQMISVYI